MKYSLLIVFCLSVFTLMAEVKVANIFGSKMVLQRNQKNPVWGTADKGEVVKITIVDQKHTAITDKDGKWRIKLDPMKAGGPFTMIVEGKNKITFEDILVGEVWICTGQSNMQWSVENSNHAELELLSANYPEIRLFTIPLVGAPEPQSEIRDSTWYSCTPESLPKFSGAGYFFGLRLHQILGVPVGLINASWGASSLETWIPREDIVASNQHNELLEDWELALSEFSLEMMKAHAVKYKAWEAAGKPGERMRPPRDIRTAQNRPGNGYNGVIHPIIGYGIKGSIWCQGETNIGRGYQYGQLFPMMINSWRHRWQQGDFSFYWVQLAAFKEEEKVPANSSWAEIREATTNTLSLPNTGEVITMDLGEGNDIHYRDKQTVGNRLARLALVKDYGYDMVGESPRYKSMTIKNNVITITFDNIDQGLYAFDTKTVKGFSIAGDDQKFVWAEAKIISENKVEVYADEIHSPVAVRYGWANNPVINLQDRNGLPVTGFRTDKWTLPSIKAKKAPRHYR